MRKHRCFLAVTLLEVLVLSALLLWGHRTVDVRRGASREAETALVQSLSLTDFAIWTEARYTRHPSQADRFTPFQLFPSSLEHFPAGSIIAPPEGPGPEAPGETIP